MFRPQAPSSPRELRATFERLAHSSIMRLNATSMGKLYDLMAMGVKFQALSCGHPFRLPLHVTSAHLGHIKGILCASGVADAAAAQRSSSPVLPPAAADNDAAAALQGAVREAQQLSAGATGGGKPGGGHREGTISDLLDAVERTMAAVYAHLPPGELWALHFSVLRFFQDRRVRVSVYLAEGLQLGDGSFVVPLRGPLPEGCAAPGTLQRWGPDGRPAGAPEALHALAALQEGGGGERWGSAEDWRGLGRNMYSGDLGRDTGSPKQRQGGWEGGGGVPGAPQPGAATAPPTAPGPAASTAGLNAFARMFGGASGGKEEGCEPALDLDMGHLWGGGGEGAEGGPQPPPAAISSFSPHAVHRLNGALGQRSGRRLADSLHGELAAPPAAGAPAGAAAGAPNGDDLLALMDSLGT